jgi:hypothetical protein
MKFKMVLAVGLVAVGIWFWPDLAREYRLMDSFTKFLVFFGMFCALGSASLEG